MPAPDNSQRAAARDETRLWQAMADPQPVYPQRTAARCVTRLLSVPARNRQGSRLKPLPRTMEAMTEFAARFLHALAAAFGRLPWHWRNRLGDAVAVLWRALDARESRVARRNLALAYPALEPEASARLHLAILRSTARQALETLRFWTRPHAENLALLREMHGVELFDAALAAGRGVIVAAPHYGNWELLNQWLATRTPLAILYRPPESAVGEAFLQRVRADDGGRVTQVRAEGSAVRQLFKLLQGGGVVGILPDQQPKAGDGVFAPFFGVPASTSTIVTLRCAPSKYQNSGPRA